MKPMNGWCFRAGSHCFFGCSFNNKCAASKVKAKRGRGHVIDNPLDKIMPNSIMGLDENMARVILVYMQANPTPENHPLKKSTH
jgi:hypothetical protein